MVNSFYVIFSVCPFFPKVSVGILLNIVLRREKISVLLYCSVTSAFVWLRLSLHSVLFRSRRFHVPAIWSALGRIRIFFYLPDIRLFQDRTSNSFFSCSCLFPRVTTMMSSSHAGVVYSNVRSIFSWKIVGISASP